MIEFQHFQELKYNTSSTLKLTLISWFWYLDHKFRLSLFLYHDCYSWLTHIWCCSLYWYSILCYYTSMLLNEIIFIENLRKTGMHIMQWICLSRISDLLPIKYYVTKVLACTFPSFHKAILDINPLIDWKSICSSRLELLIYIIQNIN